MKRLMGLALVAALAVFSIGCGETKPPAKPAVTPPTPMPMPGPGPSPMPTPNGKAGDSTEKPADGTDDKPAGTDEKPAEPAPEEK